MLLVASGASGAGKTTARFHATPLLGEQFVPVELWNFGPIPPVPTVEWRQQTIEKAVQRAIELDAEGKHLLFAGDPVPAGEALAAPSADRIDIAVCLLDVDPETQNARLDGRDDPQEWRHANLGFADWMRHHATDPQYVPEAITNDSWDGMRWERWLGADIADRWAMTVIDTSPLTPEEMGAALAAWAHAAVAGEAPVFRAGWFK